MTKRKYLLMRAPSVNPIDLPRDFNVDEMFFSTTDAKGVIQSGNAVFARVSGYGLGELVGHPHNIIRHPDMPRVVFRLLWAYLRRDLPVAALVKNMAKDGRYYWVIALVTPVPGGYLSVRFKPTAAISTEVMALYAKLRATEAAETDRGATGAAAMDAAERSLSAELGARGLAGYDNFMWKLLHEEMKSRELLAGGVLGATTPPNGTEGGAAGASLDAILTEATRAYEQINALYRWLDELTVLHEQLMGKSARISQLTDNIRFVALSTTIKAGRLGHEGRSLGTIAQHLSEVSTRTSQEVQAMTGHTRQVSAELHAVIFNLAGARLLLEMMMFFVRELRAADSRAADCGEAPGVARAQMIGVLQQAFHATTARAIGFLTAFGQRLGGLTAVTEGLQRTVLMLHVAQVGGKVEASRIQDDGAIMALLTEIHGHIGATVGELNGIGEATGRFTALLRSVPVIAQTIDQTVVRIGRDVRALSRESAAAVSGQQPVVADEAGRGAQNSAVPGVRAKGMTSRMLATPVTNISRRSKPSPKPACGTLP
jgi:PAS domain S-box-containing protein